jgi:hypothetical protein
MCRQMSAYRGRSSLDNPDHPDTLTARSNIASWTGECGDAREALKVRDDF